MEVTDLPPGVELGHILGASLQEPLPSLAPFDRLYQEPDEKVAQLVGWVEPQSVCDDIIRWHGYAGLRQILQGIAHAAAAKRIHMGNRVASVAQAMGLEVF